MTLVSLFHQWSRNPGVPLTLHHFLRRSADGAVFQHLAILPPDLTPRGGGGGALLLRSDLVGGENRLRPSVLQNRPSDVFLGIISPFGDSDSEMVSQLCGNSSANCVLPVVREGVDGNFALTGCSCAMSSKIGFLLIHHRKQALI